MTPREAATKAFYECEGNNEACLKAAFDAFEEALDMWAPIYATIRSLEAEFGQRVARVNFPELYAAIAKASQP